MEAAQGPILQDNDGFYDGAMVWKKTFNKVKKIVTEVPRVKRKRRKRQVKVESQHKNKHILAGTGITYNVIIAIDDKYSVLSVFCYRFTIFINF